MAQSSISSVWNDSLTAKYAPPPFIHEGRLIVPIDVSTLAMRFDVDILQQQVIARTVVQFSASRPGYPFLDLVPEPTRLKFDGASLNTSQFSLVSPPENEAFVRFLDVELDSTATHTLEVEYPLGDSTVVFTGGGVRLGFFLNDLIERAFLERYTPANLEFDQSQMTMEFAISGAQSQHRLFSNGDVVEETASSWKLKFPDYFTCSSSYVHLTNRPLAVVTGNFPGQERNIPVTVYGEDETIVNDELSHALEIMRELESAYGPYAHKDLLIYVAETLEPPLAGMEYCGATMTNPGTALEHEISHSWFGRGVMPANGNAGWIDEAIARWRDYGYPRANSAPDRLPVNLAGFSPYRRRTTRDAYNYGSLLLSEIDYLLANQGGLRPVLKSLFLRCRREVIDTSFFRNFLEQQTGLDLGNMFARYVYGQTGYDSVVAAQDELTSEHRPVFGAAELAGLWKVPEPVPPPRPYTFEELKSLV